jgi:hypothetical protein
MISAFATPTTWPSKLGRTGNRNLVAVGLGNENIETR